MRSEGAEGGRRAAQAGATAPEPSGEPRARAGVLEERRDPTAPGGASPGRSGADSVGVAGVGFLAGFAGVADEDAALGAFEDCGDGGGEGLVAAGLNGNPGADEIGRQGGGIAVPKDYVLAHMWTNIAVANGNKEAREFRDKLERDMTRAEIRRAMELARPRPQPGRHRAGRPYRNKSRCALPSVMISCGEL